jgi:hypothetical protein
MMTRRVIPFVVLSAFLAGACSEGVGAKEAKATKEKALKVIPSDSKVVVGINLASARKSKWWKKIEEQIAKDDGEDNKLAKIEKACGLKPLEIVNSVVIGLDKLGGRKYDDEGNENKEKVLMVVSGNFDKAQIKACFEKAPEALGKKGKVTEEGEILKLEIEGEDDPLVTYWLDAKTVMITSETDNAKIKEMASGKGPSKTVGEMIGKVNAGSTFWLAMDAADLGGGMGRMPIAPPAAVWMNGNVGGGADLEVGLRYGSSSEAKKAYEQGEAMWKMAKNEPEVKAFLDGVDVKLRQSGNDVIATVKVSEKAADNLFKQAMDRGGDED